MAETEFYIAARAQHANDRGHPGICTRYRPIATTIPTSTLHAVTPIAW
ncbi:Uncharacterised protein [Vibrio cholerae]|nr:Uncharacterised protein [Vibrio cholerae]